MNSNSDLIISLESIFGLSFGSKSVSDTVVVIVTTSAAVIIGFLFFLWRRSSDRSKPKPLVLKPLPVEVEEDEVEVGSGKTKLTIFYGTQTGTAEGFAKVKIICFFPGGLN
uniref:Flavodoxin-like domain-containing protein n=1 Tax=Davidia involucrata TaxID=16924 RepID=A0A5B7BKH4_DAVIN